MSKLVDHVGANGLFEEFLSACRDLHSTETVLLRVQHNIFTARHQNLGAPLVILDLSAAFDTTDQQQLSYLLETDYAVTGVAMSRLRTYLEGRTQRVQIDFETCDYVPPNYGVPPDGAVCDIQDR